MMCSWMNNHTLIHNSPNADRTLSLLSAFTSHITGYSPFMYQGRSIVQILLLASFAIPYRQNNIVHYCVCNYVTQQFCLFRLASFNAKCIV